MPQPRVEFPELRWFVCESYASVCAQESPLNLRSCFGDSRWLLFLISARGSDAVLVVPIRGFSCTEFCVRESRLALRSSGVGRDNDNRREFERRGTEDEDFLDAEVVLVDRSSGGGVGGNTLRVRGGSDC